MAGATAIALSASYLGAAEGWNQAGPLLGIGMLLILAPAKALPNPTILLGLLGLFVCAMLGFLPSTWLGSSVWHIRLQQAIPALGSTLSLQPWQTLFSLGLLVGTIFYGIWLIQWQPSNRAVCLQAMATGIAILATLALASHFAGISIPIWHPSQGFGPFANRNQTGALMGLGAIIALGLLASGLRGGHWTSCWWIVALVACLGAQFLSNSRASIFLLLAATTIWFVHRLGITLGALTIGAGVILLIVAFALLLGEQVVGRLQEFFVDGAGLRGSIYRDTARLIAAAPLGGIGLGNFAAIFPFFSSLNSMRVIHPESDWLWLAGEAGIGSVLFCIIIVTSLLSQPANPANRREKDVLFAGFAGVMAFLCHTVFDVPAHRLGTLLPALFVAALCTRPRLLYSGARWIPWGSRVTGIALVVWAIFLLRVTSTTAIPQREFAEGHWAAAQARISDALTIAPLDWSLYLMRGSANVRLGKWVEALGDFRAARVIEPKLAVVPFDEGCAWLGTNSGLTIAAWKAALRRNAEDKNLYLQMLDKSVPYQETHQAVLRLADEHLDLALAAVGSGYSDQTTLDSIESKRLELTSEQQAIFDRGKSRRAAAAGNYRQAYELGVKTLARVAFPPRGQMSEDEYRIALVRDPTDFAAAYNLCLILRSQEKKREALRVLESVTKQAGCPNYFYVIKGDLVASMGNWSGAWEAISDLVR
jgi:O-Antigen ligase